MSQLKTCVPELATRLAMLQHQHLPNNMPCSNKKGTNPLQLLYSQSRAKWWKLLLTMSSNGTYSPITHWPTLGLGFMRITRFQIPSQPWFWHGPNSWIQGVKRGWMSWISKQHLTMLEHPGKTGANGHQEMKTSIVAFIPSRLKLVSVVGGHLSDHPSNINAD